MRVIHNVLTQYLCVVSMQCNQQVSDILQSLCSYMFFGIIWDVTLMFDFTHQVIFEKWLSMVWESNTILSFVASINNAKYDDTVMIWWMFVENWLPEELYQYISLKYVYTSFSW